MSDVTARTDYAALDESAARLTGVPVDRAEVQVYVMSGRTTDRGLRAQGRLLAWGHEHADR
jgi:hypothetical protein